MEHFMTLISLIVLGYNFLPWNLAAELSLSSRDSHCWKKTCSGVCKSQLPAAASPPRHGFLQLFCQILTSSRKEQVQLLEVINSAAPITPLLKSREWSQVPCRNWQRLGVCGNSCWADASFSHCNSLLLFCLCQSNWRGEEGRENLSSTEFCISQLQIIVAGVSGLLLQDMLQLQAFTHYYSNINSSAMTRLYSTLGHFCYKRKCMGLAFCSLVPLLHLSLFLLYAETAS